MCMPCNYKQYCEVWKDWSVPPIGALQTAIAFSAKSEMDYRLRLSIFSIAVNNGHDTVGVGDA